MPEFSSSLILIGERLNTQRERFRAKVTERDAAGVRSEALRQVKAGATHLDVNATGSPTETLDLCWMLETILPHIPDHVGVVLDSSSLEALAAGFEILGARGGTIININTSDTEKFGASVEMATAQNAGVIAVLADSAGVSGLSTDRLKRAEEVHNWLMKAGIPEERHFYDPQLLPVAFDPNLPRTILQTVKELRQRWPDAHAIAGLSNVSFNMPERRLLNRVYLAMLLAVGLDAVICDPCVKQISHTLTAARALLGQDDFMASYLETFTPED